ncbi:hypothetical protein LCGC14_2939220, partial [marine sediment metagenome]
CLMESGCTHILIISPLGRIGPLRYTLDTPVAVAMLVTVAANSDSISASIPA